MKTSINPTNLMAYYSFDQIQDLHQDALDISGNGLNLRKPLVGGGLSSPNWAKDYGINGPGLKFYGNNSQSQCIYRDGVSKFFSTNSGTVCFWIKPLGKGNQKQCILAISNGFVPIKTEFIIEADYLSDIFKASIVKDGVVLWEVHTPKKSLSDAIDLWTHIGFVQDGITPQFYINGVQVETKTSISNSVSGWFSSFLTAKSIPTKLSIGAAPRNYSPFMALGLFAFMDEIKIWESPLSPSDIQKDYATKNEVVIE